MELSGSDLSITICDDEYITELNSSWRNIESTTDILSFPASDPEELKNSANSPVPVPLGDIVINISWIERDNADNIEYSLSRLLVHGMAHLLGHDHDTESNAIKMKNCEMDLMHIVNDEFCGILDKEKYLVT